MPLEEALAEVNCRTGPFPEHCFDGDNGSVRVIKRSIRRVCACAVSSRPRRRIDIAETAYRVGVSWNRVLILPSDKLKSSQAFRAEGHSLKNTFASMH